MLSKVWGAKGIILDGEYNYEVSAYDGSSSSYDISTTSVITNVTTGGTTDIMVNRGYKSNYSSSQITNIKAKISILVDGVEYGYTVQNTNQDFPYGTQNYRDVNDVISVNLEYGEHTITVKAIASHFNANGVSSSVILKTVKIINAGTVDTKTGKRNIKPKEVKPIGNLATGTSFGRLNNNDIYVGAKPTTSFTTGNIAPGNFVGLIEFGGYKIPYYL